MDKPFVFEAIATVRYTPLADWIARGDGGRYVVKRLTRELTPEQVDAAARRRTTFEGKPYDLYFEWSDERIYCSELVWKMYQQALGMRAGQLQKLREFDLTDPVVKAKMRERYGSHVPLDEPVISPGAQFASPLLRDQSQISDVRLENLRATSATSGPCHETTQTRCEISCA